MMLDYKKDYDKQLVRRITEKATVFEVKLTVEYIKH